MLLRLQFEICERIGNAYLINDNGRVNKLYEVLRRLETYITNGLNGILEFERIFFFHVQANTVR